MTLENSPSDILDGVVRALRQSVPRPLAGKPIAAEQDLRTDLAIDSLGLITLVTLLEGEFGLQLGAHTADLLRIRTVRELNDLVVKLRSSGSR